MKTSKSVVGQPRVEAEFFVALLSKHATKVVQMNSLMVMTVAGEHTVLPYIIAPNRRTVLEGVCNL